MFSNLLNFLFPSGCPVCGSSSDSLAHNPLCSSCWQQIEKYNGPACMICGVPAVSPHTSRCESCLKSSPPFSRIIFYGVYEGILKKSIHLLKFSGIKRLARSLGSLMLELPLPASDCLVPVPLHAKSLRLRGFNQSALIGRLLSKNIKAPLMLDALRKNRETPPQTYVTGRERLKNIKGAFSSSEEVKGRRVLLIDDVITTGATVRECSKMLRKAGAEDVTVIALARSMPKL